MIKHVSYYFSFKHPTAVPSRDKATREAKLAVEAAEATAEADIVA